MINIKKQIVLLFAFSNFSKKIKCDKKLNLGIDNLR